MVISRAYRPVHPRRRCVELASITSHFNRRSSLHRDIAVLHAEAFTACMRLSMNRVFVIDERQSGAWAPAASGESAGRARLCIG
jgi:hypothetical protein